MDESFPHKETNKIGNMSNTSFMHSGKTNLSQSNSTFFNENYYYKGKENIPPCGRGCSSCITERRKAEITEHALK